MLPTVSAQVVRERPLPPSTGTTPPWGAATVAMAFAYEMLHCNIRSEPRL
jgi:hypothetical protein